MGYKTFWEKLKSKECIFVAKQGLMKNKGYKTTLGLRMHTCAKTFYGEGERRKGRRELGQGKDQGLGGIVSHLLLLRD